MAPNNIVIAVVEWKILQPDAIRVDGTKQRLKQIFIDFALIVSTTKLRFSAPPIPAIQVPRTGHPLPMMDDAEEEEEILINNVK
ncbi:hypothetical protein TSMEX_001404 [Taenia solium]|eukprot:TsM_000480800 transcript=TsM_000480800 gene=TsM_000480800